MCAGGAGGKGTWGKLVAVYDDDGHTHDQKDPNYDSEEEVVCDGCVWLFVCTLSVHVTLFYCSVSMFGKWLNVLVHAYTHTRTHAHMHTPHCRRHTLCLPPPHI